MKNGKIHGKFGFLIGLAVAGALLFAACQVDSPSSEPEEGYGRVIVTIGEDGEERTALPVSPTSSTYDRFVFIFTDTNNNSLKFTKEPVGSTFTLPKGTYSLTVKAYSDAMDADEDYSAIGTSEGTFNVGTASTTTIKIKLDTVDSGTGTFTYTIQYPEGAQAALSLVRYAGNDETAQVQGFTVVPGSSSGLSKIAKTTNDIKVGYYLFTVRIVMNDGSAAGGVSEVVHIYKNQNTVFSKDFSAANLTPIGADDLVQLLEAEIETWVAAPTLARGPEFNTEVLSGTGTEADPFVRGKFVTLYYSTTEKFRGSSSFPIDLMGGWANTADWVISDFTSPKVVVLSNVAYPTLEYRVRLYPVVKYNVTFGPSATIRNVSITGTWGSPPPRLKHIGSPMTAVIVC